MPIKAIAIPPRITLKEALEVTALPSSAGNPLGVETGEVTDGVVTLLEVVSATTSVVGIVVGIPLEGVATGSSSGGYGVKVGRT